MLTQAMIDQLREGYGKIETIDAESPTYRKLAAFLDSLPNDHLVQLWNAKVKFVSNMAFNRLIKRGAKVGVIQK